MDAAGKVGCFSSWSLKYIFCLCIWLCRVLASRRGIFMHRGIGIAVPGLLDFVVHGRGSTTRGSQFPSKGSNLCPLQCQVDSLATGPSGSPSSWISEGISDSVVLPYLCLPVCPASPHLRSLWSRGMSQGSLVPGPFCLKVFRSHVAFWVLHYLTENEWAEKAEKRAFKPTDGPLICSQK